MLSNHPLRVPLADELHMRPFPKIMAPASAAYLAITSMGSVAKDLAVLVKLLKAIGHSEQKPNGSHYFGDFGDFKLKWERHTEFVTYTLFVVRENGAEMFVDNPHKFFPEVWMQKTTGQILTSCFLEVVGPFTLKDTEKFVTHEFFKHFKDESLAVNYVLGKEAAIASDFMIDTDGHIKLAILAIGQVGEN